jgi:hypothetical protein
MATDFPKFTMHIYEHALFMHIHTLLNHGSVLDGSSSYLEAYTKVWKQHLVRHTNGGGGKANSPFEEPDDKQSEAGRTRQRENSVARKKSLPCRLRGPAHTHMCGISLPSGVQRAWRTHCSKPSKDSHEQCTRQPWLRVIFWAYLREHFRRVDIIFDACVLGLL